MGQQPGLFEQADRRLANELQYLHKAAGSSSRESSAETIRGSKGKWGGGRSQGRSGCSTQNLVRLVSWLLCEWIATAVFRCSIHNTATRFIRNPIQVLSGPAWSQAEQDLLPVMFCFHPTQAWPFEREGANALFLSG
jgi:hypothetical protein